MIRLVLYQQHIRTIPQVNPNYWSFAITGKVQRPLILSYADLRALPAQTLRAALSCAGTSTDRPLLGEAVWGGVPLSTLLAELAIDPLARYARISAADGYTTVLRVESLTQAMLAYTMDGDPLPIQHGYPARLIAPGLFGYKMAKWIERIELTDSPEGGFWESRDFSLDGTATVKAAITGRSTSSGIMTLSGVAYVGIHPVWTVQISIDSSDWMPVSFTPGDPSALTHWQIDWTPPAQGDYSVTVRASDGLTHAEHSLSLRVR